MSAANLTTAEQQFSERLRQAVDRIHHVPMADAGDELARILAERAESYPRAIAAGQLTLEVAAQRIARLATAWAHLADPRYEATGPHVYFTVADAAEHLARQRGLIPRSPTKGRY